MIDRLDREIKERYGARIKEIEERYGKEVADSVKTSLRYIKEQPELAPPETLSNEVLQIIEKSKNEKEAEKIAQGIEDALISTPDLLKSIFDSIEVRRKKLEEEEVKV